MHVRIQRSRNKDGTYREYVQIVESIRQPGKKSPTHRIVASLGRLDEVQKGDFDPIIKALTAYSNTYSTDNLQLDLSLEHVEQVGPRLLLEKVWKQLGLQRILAQKGISDTYIDCIFQMILSRLDEPASKRQTQAQAALRMPNPDANWSLTTYYRSLDALLPCIRGVEEALYRTRIDSTDQPSLFNSLDVVFFDTTSVKIDAREPRGLFYRGFSKDNRPDIPQCIVALVTTNTGSPICQYVLPGNTNDSKAFAECIQDVVKRFPIRRAIIVADRGCISKDIVSIIKEKRLEYIFAVKNRNNKTVQTLLQNLEMPLTDYDDVLSYKDIRTSSDRYVIVRNAIIAEHDAMSRQDRLEKLRLKQGKSIKPLIGNKGYAQLLKTPGTIEIDEARVQSDALYDGIWVLQTNVQDMTAPDLIEAYKGLLTVESWFRALKTDFEVDPLYHWTPERVKAHVAICFLTLVVWFELRNAFSAKNPGESFHDAWQAVRQLQCVTVNTGSQRIRMRNDPGSAVAKVFSALHCTMPPRLKIL